MRSHYTVLFLLAFVLATTAAAQTYRWVDEDGVVHYSDAPNPASENPEADRVDIPPANVIQSTRPSAAPRPATTRETNEAPTYETETAASYRSVKILTPAAGSTLWNIGGQLTVSMQVSPALQPGDGYVLYLDGQLYRDSPTQASSITLSDVYRGEHTLKAAVRNAAGQELAVSEPVTFFVQQTSVNRN